MARLSHELDGLALDLAWSQWTELGVDSIVRRQEWRALDLEPLIIFTASRSSDSRLRAASLEWCIDNVRLASAFRLRNFASQASSKTQAAFGRYAATVKAHSGVSWPAHGDPYMLAPRLRPGRAPDLRRPALIQLRLRALVGVTARAEILKLMLANPDRPLTKSALAGRAAFTKGRVAQALELLTAAGFVAVHASANRPLYRLARPADLARSLEWLPADYPDWWPIFKVAETLIEYAHLTSGPPSARVSRAQAALSEIEPELRRLGIPGPPALEPRSVAAFEHWALEFLERQVEGRESTRLSPATYRIRRLASGVWEAFAAATDREARRLTGGKLANSADRVAQAIFADAVAAGAEVAVDDAAIQVVSREFAAEVLRQMGPGEERPIRQNSSGAGSRIGGGGTAPQPERHRSCKNEDFHPNSAQLTTLQAN